MTSNPQTDMAIVASPALREKIDGARRKHVGVAAGTGASLALSAFIVLLGVLMLLDWWLDFPLWIRGVLLISSLGAMSYLLWRFVITPIRRQPDDDALALRVEKAFPQFRSRLISSIQFPRPGGIPSGGAPSLARMTIAETEAMAGPLDFASVVSTSHLKKVAGWTVAVVAIGLFAFMYGGEVSRALLKRAFLSSTPVPRHTRVELVGGNRVVGRGDAVRIDAFARGIVPKSGRLVVKSSGRRTQEYTMEKNREGRFSRTLENVQQTFSFTVQLNDGATKPYRVEVVPRPSIATLECEQVYPAYTQLPPARRSLGDLTLLAGSQLRLNAMASKEVVRASIRFAGSSNDIPMVINSTNTRQVRGEFTVPPKGLTGFSIELVDAGGMESRDSAVYRVDVLPDRVPKVRINYPDRKEELVTRYAVMDVAFDATDDFQIAKARLRYRVGDSEDAEIRNIDLEVGTNVVKELKSRYEWRIRDFQPPLVEGTRIEFWLEAEDNNNVTGPGIGITEHQLARVVSENDKRADLLNRAGDFLGTISDVTGDQEKVNLRLFDIIMEKRAP